jgi:hypothetical protein
MNLVLLALSIHLFGPPATPPPPAPALECVFEHSRYAGSCVEEVTPAENQTHLQACQAILGCLNNPQCVASYCQATTLRGGWTLVSPKPAPQATRQP